MSKVSRKDHGDEFEALPADPSVREAAMQKIRLGIWQKLFEELQIKHQEGVRKYLDALAAETGVSL